MSTSYLVGTEVTIERNEGDTGSVVFTVPVAIDLSVYSTVIFQARDFNETLLIDKSTSSGITVNSQEVTVALVASDTTCKTPGGRWELQVSDGTDIITIGRGDFKIIKEIAK